MTIFFEQNANRDRVRIHAQEGRIKNWFHYQFRLVLIAGILPVCVLAQVVSIAAGSKSPLAVLQTQYRLRAGERVRIEVPSETADFIRSAKSRTAIPDGQRKTFAMGPNVAGDQVLLAVPLTTPPGE